MSEKKKPKILIPVPIHDSGVQLLLQKGYEVRILPDDNRSTLLQEVADASGMIIRLTEISEAVIEAGRSLKVIARHGVGYDKIDIGAASRRKIPVCITPRANAQSVAEHTLALMLALAKQIVPCDRATRHDNWDLRNSARMFDLHGKILGIVGLGRIGALVCRMASAGFGMQVLVFSPRQSREKIETAGGRQAPDFDSVLKEADFISLHLPLKPETRGLINEEAFQKMKPSAFLINTARGPIIDEEALIRNLKAGRIAGAGLDVFDPEPPLAGNPLFELPNVVLSPHTAGLTVECVERMATHAAQAVIDVLEGRRPEGVVNPEIWK